MDQQLFTREQWGQTWGWKLALLCFHCPSAARQARKVHRPLPKISTRLPIPFQISQMTSWEFWQHSIFHPDKKAINISPKDMFLSTRALEPGCHQHFGTVVAEPAHLRHVRSFPGLYADVSNTCNCDNQNYLVVLGMVVRLSLLSTWELRAAKCQASQGVSKQHNHSPPHKCHYSIQPGEQWPL